MNELQLNLSAHPVFYASDFWRIVYTAWAGGLLLVVIPLALREVRRNHDWTFTLIVAGGLISSVGEPMMDQLCRCQFAANMPGPAFNGFGRAVPYFVPPCYASVIAGSGYAVYRFLLTRPTRSTILKAWAATAVVDMVLEMPGTLAGTFRYFGDQPLYVAKFPLHMGVLNATGFFAIGFVLYLIVPYLKGWWKLALLAVPAMAFWGFQTAVAWPAWMAVNWKMGAVARDLLALAVVPLSAIAVKGMVELIVLLRTHGLVAAAESPPQTHAPPAPARTEPVAVAT